MKTAFKRVLSFLLAAAMIFGTVGAEISGIDFADIFSFEAEAASYSGTCGDNLNWSLDTSTGVLKITGTGAMKDYMYYSSTPWYSYISYIKTVQISDNVTTIGDHSFDACSNITDVTIGKNVKTIGENAFFGCRGLREIKIPDSVTTIEKSAFANCETLKNVTLGNNLETIGESAFECCYELSVVIPDSVTTIEKKAFYSCVNAEISIGQNSKLVAIGENAFESCRNFKTINLPDSVNRIGLYAFYNTGYYNDVSNWENGLLYIGKHLVSSNSAASGAVEIKPGTLTIADGIFNQRSGISSVTIPGSVKSISSVAFLFCRDLKNVTISEGITTIKKQAFTSSYNLISVTIPDSVTTIEDAAFAGCTALKYVHIPVDVTTIGSDILNSTSAYICSDTEDCYAKTYADKNGIDFKLCDGHIFLTNISVDTLPSKTEYYVGDTLDTTGLTLTATFSDGSKETVTSGFTCTPTVFDTEGTQNVTVTYEGKICTFDVTVEPADEIVSGQCGDNLTWTLNITKGILDITGTGAMWNWTSSSKAPWYDYRSSIKMVYIDSGVTTIGNYAFYGCYSFTSVTIPNSVKTIGDRAFESCDSLTIVTIPDSVTSIGDLAFNYCTNLTNITVDNDNKNYSSDEYGVLFNKDKTTLIQYSLGNTRTSYIIPDSVTTIGASAFKVCRYITRVTIGNGVTIIGEKAFGSSSLASVTIPDSVTIIGAYAFYHCTSLENVTIGKSVTIIGEGAFNTCDHLTSVTIPDGVIIIDDGAFSKCISLTSVIIPDSVKTIGDTAFSSCSNLTGVTFPDSVKDIGNWAFESCNSLTNVTIPDSVKTIGDSAFRWCASLTSVTIGNGVTIIGDGVFESCVRLTSIIIPDSVTIIGEHAFAFCDSLEYVHIPASVTSISNHTLTGNSVYICSDTNDCYAKTYADKNNIEFRLCEGHGVEKVLASIFIKNLPEKTEYFVGDTLNTTGLTLTATYNNGTTETVTSGFTCSPTKLATAGKQTVTVSYGGKTCTFEVTVKEKPVSNDYSVTYMVNGKRYAKYIVTVGDPVPAPAVNPIVDGMIFEGWSPEIVQLMPANDLVYTAVFHKHVYTGSIAIHPTCTQHGVMLYTCSCGDCYNEIIPALGHDWGRWITVVEATPSSNGQKVRYCSRCGAAEYDVIPAPSANFRVETIADQEYTGFGLYPAVKVYSLSGKRLDEYDHYEVSYENNINCGVATATVKGVGEYSGVIKVNFNIVKKDIANLSFAEIPDVTYSGDAYTPDPVIYYGDILLVKNVDYTVSYSANVNIGKATITITGIGNYTGTKVIYFNISKNSTSFSVPVVGSQVYTGKAVTPDFNLFSGDKLLIKGVDYTVTYENNINVGYGRIIIKGIGNYSGTIVVIFRIVSTQISLATVPSFSDISYDGNEFAPDFNANPITYGGKKLVEGVDFKVEIYNNRNAGTVKIVIIGIGNFTGTIVIYVNINAVDISGVTVSRIDDVEYNGAAQTPSFKVTKNGKTLVKGVDYTVEYRNNTFVGTATVVIKGIGNYKGEKSFTFRIVEPTYYELVVTTESETLGYDSIMQVWAEINPYLEMNYTFIYESSNAKIASVDESGVVKALDEGEVVITVTVVDEDGNPVLNPDGEEIRSEIRIRCTMTFWQKIIRFFRKLFSIFTRNALMSAGIQMN